ncbi:hypothetical protein ACSO1_18010 [Acinetobacter calcoaceticus]|nr:hypothetical protein ACSO1_18010 [Acinetobacter calcoaceticus]
MSIFKILNITYGKKMLKYISLITISIFSAHVFADDSNIVNEAEALAVDGKFYAASYNVPYDEAVRRLLIMHGTHTSISTLKGQVKNNLQGIYYDNSKNNFGLTVDVNHFPSTVIKSINVTPRSSSAIQKILSSKGNSTLRSKFKITDSDIRTVATLYSQSLSAPITLNKKIYKLKDERILNINSKRQLLKKALPELKLVYDDERTGNAKVYVKSDNGNAKQIAEKILNVPVQVIITPYGSRVATRGGSPLTSQNIPVCFSGFIGSRNGKLGIITAGHCANDKNYSSYLYKDRDGTQYTIPLLPVTQPITSGWRDDSISDLGFLPAGTTTQQAAKAEFYADSTVNFRKLTATKTRLGTAWDNGTVNGAYICHLGKTAPLVATLTQSCGEVESINSSNADGQGNTFVAVKNTDGNAGYPHTTGNGSLRCYPGDSGSPWFAGTTGYGIMHACFWQSPEDSSTPVTVSIYTSLDYLNSIGTTIVTQ